MANASARVEAPFRIERSNMGPGFQAAGARGHLDPFISVDHFLMSQPTFPPHPHAGFNVLTYMLPRSAGSFVNRASFDRQTAIDPGDLHWTVASSGMVHEEVPTNIGTAADGLQIFINLHSSQKAMAPASLHQTAAQTPQLAFAGGTVRVVLGALALDGASARSRLEPPTPVTMLDVALDADASLHLPLEAAHNVFALVISGSVRFDNAHAWVGSDGGAAFGVADVSRSLTIQAGQPSQVIVFSGLPIGERVVRSSKRMNPQYRTEGASLHQRRVGLAGAGGDSRYTNWPPPFAPASRSLAMPQPPAVPLPTPSAFAPADTALLLIDHKVGTMQLIRTSDRDQVAAMTLALAKTARVLGMPVIFTTSQEDRMQGPLLPALAEAHPQAFEQRIKRAGLVNAWRDADFRGAVLATGRRNLVMAGVTTDVCLVFPAIDAVQEGFQVQAVMDASGSPFDLSEALSQQRMRDAGVVLTATNTLIAELAQDWSTHEGQQLRGLLFAGVLPPAPSPPWHPAGAS